MYQSTKKLILVIVGFLSLGLGIAGIFLPLLPTTPFVLLAAFCFSRSSERLHRWLLKNPHLGPIITDWEKNGVIRRKVKVISTLTILAIISIPLFGMSFPLYLKGMVVLIIAGVLIFIWTRPSRPKQDL